jgi:hypothetical protein
MFSGTVVKEPTGTNSEAKMNFEKEVLQKSVDVLMDKAENCLDLAKAQHKIADKQHDSADKLETIGHALEDDAVELKGELEMVAGRGSPPYVEPVAVPSEAASSMRQVIPK